MGRLVVDTTVWSLLFRRRDHAPFSASDAAALRTLEDATRSDEAVLLGPVRQEILNGLTPRERFSRVRDALRAFGDEPIRTEDHERAAEMFTTCKVAGVQGSDVDYLICAVSERLDAEILTLDSDFVRYARLLPVRLCVI